MRSQAIMIQSQQEEPVASWLKAEPKSVSIQGASLICRIAEKGATDLTEAIDRGMHEAYLQLRTEYDLVGFVRKFGPVSRSADGRGIVSASINDFWIEHARLMALVRLKESFIGGHNVHSAIETFLEAQGALLKNRKTGNSLVIAPVDPEDNDRGWLEVDPVKEWLKRAHFEKALEYAGRLIWFYFNPQEPWQMLNPVAKNGKGTLQSIVQAPETIHDLVAFLIWLSEWNNQPIQTCRAFGCQNIFRCDSRHVRYYCSTKCQHRETVARSRQKRKKDRRKANAKSKAKRSQAR
jgi:hypothetical protein